MRKLVITFEWEPLFVSKWYLNLAAFEGGWCWYPAAALVVIATPMAMVCIWRVVEVVNFAAPKSEPIPEVPAGFQVPTREPVLARFHIGINASVNMDAAKPAVPPLLRTEP
jgi:hypothetical protein